MDSYLSSISALVGAFSAFLSSIIYSLPQEKLKESLEKNIPYSKRLSRIKYEYDESLNEFLIIEIFSYLIASFFLGVQLTIDHANTWLVLLIFLFSLISLLFFRTVIFSIGSRKSEILAFKLAPVLYFSFLIMHPLTSLVNKIYLWISGKTNEEASREELNALFESAREEGSIEDEEYRILKNIMQFNDIYVSDVMTPRTVIFSCPANSTIGDIINMPELQMYSRFPIWEGESIDDGVVGYVMSRDVLNAALHDLLDRKLSEFAREVYYIPENAELAIALEKFLQRRQHLFAVVDEYGGIEGLITMEDVLETILGVEIVDEVDKIIDMRAVAKNRRDRRIESMLKKE